MRPPLTSVTYEGTQIGAIAAKVLWELSHQAQQEGAYLNYFCHPELVERGSCAGKSGGSPE